MGLVRGGDLLLSPGLKPSANRASLIARCRSTRYESALGSWSWTCSGTFGGSLPHLAETSNAEWWPKAGLMELRDQLIRGGSRGRAR
jgi:hypothetical protein